MSCHVIFLMLFLKRNISRWIPATFDERYITMFRHLFHSAQKSPIDLKSVSLFKFREKTKDNAYLHHLGLLRAYISVFPFSASSSLFGSGPKEENAENPL